MGVSFTIRSAPNGARLERRTTIFGDFGD